FTSFRSDATTEDESAASPSPLPTFDRNRLRSSSNARPSIVSVTLIPKTLIRGSVLLTPLLETTHNRDHPADLTVVSDYHPRLAQFRRAELSSHITACALGEQPPEGHRSSVLAQLELDHGRKAAFILKRVDGRLQLPDGRVAARLARVEQRQDRRKDFVET